MTPITIEEAQRTSPLALWRYAHEYLSTARSLCEHLRITCLESQAPYHLAAQGLEFALKAFLLTRGASMAEMQRDLGHRLDRALERCEALGLPPIPAERRAAIAELAPFHQDRQFVYLVFPEDSFPDIVPLVDAGVSILDGIAPHVVDHYILHLATHGTPPSDVFVRRLRAALSATSETVHPEAVVHAGTAEAGRDRADGGARPRSA